MFHSEQEEKYYNEKAETLYPLFAAFVRHYNIEDKVVFKLCNMMLEHIIDFPEDYGELNFHDEDVIAKIQEIDQREIDEADDNDPDNELTDLQYDDMIAEYDKNIKINRLADNLLQEHPSYKGLGYCHTFWPVKKALHLLLEDRDWKSPAELNPDTLYD